MEKFRTLESMIQFEDNLRRLEQDEGMNKELKNAVDSTRKEIVEAMKGKRNKKTKSPSTHASALEAFS